ncbi:MAG TPA: hypothetical protein VMT74_04100 [Gaiellaceae bacterium]|nr:hypothetical protein [Gaiellaceae bacterium]
MSTGRIGVVLAGAIAAALGLLWSLQGAGAVRLRPILCVSNCTPVTGTSPPWLAVGVIALLAGIALVGAGLRHSGRGR